ncbi:MAG: phospholipase domain-containing protein [Chitinophagaceae bacterium]
MEIKLVNLHKPNYTLEIIDNAYCGAPRTVLAQGSHSIVLNLLKSFGWYDFTVRIKGNPSFQKRYAGHVETGKESFTDPLMGGV